MQLSVQYPRQLLKYESGLLLGKYNYNLNCVCVTSLTKKTLEEVEIKTNWQRETVSKEDLCVLGTQKCEKMGDALYIQCTITHAENQSFTVFSDCEANISTVKNCNKETNVFLFLYDQHSVRSGIDSLTHWKSSDVTVSTESIFGCKSIYTMLSKEFVQFLFESNLEIKASGTNKHSNLTEWKVTVFKIWLKIWLFISILQKGLICKNVFQLIMRILKVSSFATQICSKLNLTKKLLFANKPASKLLKSDILCGMLFDMLLGVLFYTTMYRMSGIFNNYTFDMLMSSISYIGKEVQLIIEWLMGIPIGLKLNSPLNKFLGKFFLHHVQLWLEYIQMLLSTLHDRQDYFMQWPLFSSCFGISLFIAFLSDVVSLLSFHIYCFYVYGARLYRLQFVGLMSLWRLFRGKKWNPLRQRVDTLQDATEGENPRFFLGTLLFTILLFLLPTTALYYAIFAALRIAIMFLQNMLFYTQKFLSCFPWCTLAYRWGLPTMFPSTACIKFLHSIDPIDALPKQEYNSDSRSTPTNFSLSIEPQSYSTVIANALNKLNLVHCQEFKIHSFLVALITGQLLKWA